MKISVTYDLDGSQQHQQHDDLTPEQVAQHLTSGGRIWPLHSVGSEGNVKFEGADFLAIAINTRSLPLERILAAEFTQRHCTLVVHAAADQVGGYCVLVFCLPEVETETRQYALMLEGLKTKYAGVLKSRGVMQQWGASGLTDFKVLGGALDKAAEGQLKILGVESRQLAAARGYKVIRSLVTLDSTTKLEVGEQGSQIPLEQLEAGVTVYCPVHYDIRPVALTVAVGDGRLAVYCPVCERTYAQRGEGEHYDFGQFEREMTKIERAEASQPVQDRMVVRSTERYLPELDLRDGVLCVKSPKGSGKTEQLEHIVRQAKERGQSVLLIGHRRSLLQSMSRRLGLECYFTTEFDLLTAAARLTADPGKGLVDVGHMPATPEQQRALAGIKPGQDPEIIKVAPVPHYAICMDSMPDLNPAQHPYDVVIIDECEQVFTHLVGDTVKDRRRQIYHRVRHYLRMASSVILMDADLGMVTMAAWRGTDWRDGTSFRFHLNAPQVSGGTVKQYAAKAQLVDRLMQAALTGEKCFVATNSKTKAEELAKTLTSRDKDLRVVCVHSDNSSSTKVQTLLRNITHEFEHNIDVLIGSPSLGTGLDITFKTASGEPRTVVQHVFGLFEGRITTHMDCDQHLMRVRHPGEVHVWIDPASQNFETDAGLWRDQLSGMMKNEYGLLGFTDEGAPVTSADDGLIDIWAEVQAATNGSINHLASLFVKSREDNGWTFEKVEADAARTKEGAAALKLGREECERERADRIVGARPFGKDWDGQQEWQRLLARKEKGLPLSDEERARHDRHRIATFYRADAVDHDLVDFDNRGRMRDGIRKMELLMAPAGHDADRDSREHYGEVVAFDRELRLVQRGLLRKLFISAGIYRQGKFNPDAVFDQDSLKTFVKTLERHSGEVEKAFGLAMRRNAHGNRVQQLGDVLRVVGLKSKLVSTVEEGGKKVRRYALDQGLLDLVVTTAKNRLTSAFKTEHVKAQEELDIQTDQWSHEERESRSVGVR